MLFSWRLGALTMRSISRHAAKLLARQPLYAAKRTPGIYSQLCSSPWLLQEIRSSDKMSAADCVVDKTAVPLAALESSNIFLKPQVVLYDGVCHLCNAGVNWVIKTDKHKRISFCAVQSDVAEPYLLVCGLRREDVLDRFLFVEGPGQHSQASTAALRVTLYLPFPYPLLGALLIIPAPLRDAIYDFVAKRRYKWFGRADNCILPKDDVLDHFIDRDEIITKLKQKMEH